MLAAEVAAYELRRCHALGCRKVRMPCVDKVEPIPECRRPVHGNRGETRSQQFQYTEPASTLASTRSARSRFGVYTPAVRPYSVSFIARTASSSEVTV